MQAGGWAVQEALASPCQHRAHPQGLGASQGLGAGIQACCSCSGPGASISHNSHTLHRHHCSDGRMLGCLRSPWGLPEHTQVGVAREGRRSAPTSH